MTGRCPYFKNLHNLFRKRLAFQYPVSELNFQKTILKTIAYCSWRNSHKKHKFFPIKGLSMYERYIYNLAKTCWIKMRCLSLISTHAFRLSPAKVFTWDMRRVVKPVQQNEKISFALFALEVQVFQLLRNFLTAKSTRLLSWVTWTFHEDHKIFTKWPPRALSGLREDRQTSVYSQNKSYQASD